jgi:1,3-beta-glucanosyltransferase GAS1
MSAYNPTNSPQACPDQSKTWKVSAAALPPTPDESLCKCMFDSLSCVPAGDIEVSEYPDIFGFICGSDKKACAGILANASTGVYGAYSMCSAKQKLGYVLDAYYKNQGKAKDACGFNGKAALANSATVADGCKNALASASTVNSIAATATAPVAGASGGGGGSGGKKDNAASGPSKAFFTMGEVAVGLYALVAMGVGAGMVLL